MAAIHAPSITCPTIMLTRSDVYCRCHASSRPWPRAAAARSATVLVVGSLRRATASTIRGLQTCFWPLYYSARQSPLLWQPDAPSVLPPSLLPSEMSSASCYGLDSMVSRLAHKAWPPVCDPRGAAARPRVSLRYSFLSFLGPGERAKRSGNQGALPAPVWEPSHSQHRPELCPR